MRAIWLGSFITDTIYLSAGALTKRFVGSPLQRRLAHARYKSLASHYDADVIPQHEYFAPLEAALGRLPAAAARALDVCTGTGAVIGTVVRFFPSCHGVAVDLSPAMLSHCHRHAEEGDWPVSLAVANSARLPFRDHTFDLVSVQNAFPVPSELVRVLRPGGWAVLAYSAGGPVFPWVVSSMVRQLRTLGCATVETHKVGGGRYFLAQRAQDAA
jgi:ubiquinone/menaquinone biosynthesis C-methylase UbiE